MLKRLCLCALVIAMALLALLLSENGGEPKDIQEVELEEPGYTVMLNRYAPEDWNGGYGHYDLSFIAPPNIRFGCKLGEKYAACKEITLSYGATDGDLSPARVHLYTKARSDHLPEESLMIYDGLQPADFNAFMAWFMHDFSLYSKEKGECFEFTVVDESYAVYSLEANKNCLTAAVHMTLKLPGIRDAQINPCAGLVERLVMGMNLN